MRWRLRLALSLLAGASIPLIDLSIACRDVMSERCVWGKAYLPLTLPLYTVVAGAIIFGLATAISIARRERRRARR